MTDWQQNPGVALLTNRAVPALLDDQLALFNQTSIHAESAGNFNVVEAVAALRAKEGQRVLGADFGGDKGATRLFEVRNGALALLGDYSDDIQGNDGAGYVASLKKSAAYAEANNIPFGISWGGPMDGTKLIYHPKAKLFMSEMEAEFIGDLKAISPSITAALNDAPAGLVQGAVAAYTQHQATQVLFIINGGGLGVGVLNGSTIYATEAGHVEAVAKLNKYGQTVACGVFGATYTCIEQLGANKAGIEKQWELTRGEYMRARNIEDQYKAGDAFAGELYDNSALVVAHMIQGAASAMNIDLRDTTTAIVCHGGAFKFPYYGERVTQILNQANNANVLLMMTKDYTDANSNACLDGAAIAAITAK